MIQPKQKILIVDDEQDIVELLQYNLEKEGYEIETAENGLVCLEKAKQFNPDLIILDVMMPEMDGIETCIELRKIAELEHTIICFLTARSEDYSQIAGYESGADDYVSKPIKPKVLISKIGALLRRNDSKDAIIENSAIISNSGIEIDKEKYIVKVGTKTHYLPKKEFELLSLLVAGNGNVFTREVILNEVWGNDIVVGDRTIDVHIRKLREKIGDDFIKTIKGVGYKFVSKDN